MKPKWIFLLLIFLSPIVHSQDNVLPSTKISSIGIGIGNPYGWLGANLDLHIFRFLDFSAGLGVYDLDPLTIGAYNLGVKLYFLSIEYPIRPRISAYYGINHIVRHFGSSSSHYDLNRGFTIGAGFQAMFNRKKSIGFDFDFVYPIYNYAISSFKFTSQLKISLGLRIGL